MFNWWICEYRNKQVYQGFKAPVYWRNTWRAERIIFSVGLGRLQSSREWSKKSNWRVHYYCSKDQDKDTSGSLIVAITDCLEYCRAHYFWLTNLKYLKLICKWKSRKFVGMMRLHAFCRLTRTPIQTFWSPPLNILAKTLESDCGAWVRQNQLTNTISKMVMIALSIVSASRQTASF